MSARRRCEGAAPPVPEAPMDEQQIEGEPPGGDAGARDESVAERTPPPPRRKRHWGLILVGVFIVLPGS